MLFRKVYQTIFSETTRSRLASLRANIKYKTIPIVKNKAVPSIRHSIVALQDKNVRYMKKRLENLKNQYQGQRCFIMGNGPSLNKMDLSVFKDEFVWGSNKCYLLFNKIDWRPKFYTAVDTRVVPDINTDINQLALEYPATSFFFPAHFRTKGILKSHSNIFWYPEIELDFDNLPDGAFTTNISEWVSNVRTVTIAAMQLAVYLGFNPIYLIGCDTSYPISQTVKTEKNNSDFLLSTKDDDGAHFAPNYFGAGSKWHYPHVDRMIFHYQQSKIICDRLGVKIFNATVGGNLEVFPRVNYLDLF